MLSIYEKNLKTLRENYDNWLDPPDEDLSEEFYEEHPEIKKPDKEIEYDE